VELPTYTNIWKIEKRLYKLYDFRLPMPLPIGQVAAFLAIAVPYMLILTLAGMPFSHTWVWLYVLPPGVLAWLVTRPVLEGKRLPELVLSQVRYLSEPRTWCRMAALAEKDQMTVTATVWRRAPAVALELSALTPPADAAVLPEPVLPEPVLPEPVLPEPMLPEPVQREPVLPEHGPQEQVLPEQVLPEAVTAEAGGAAVQRPVWPEHPAIAAGTRRAVSNLPTPSRPAPVQHVPAEPNPPVPAHSAAGQRRPGHPMPVEPVSVRATGAAASPPQRVRQPERARASYQPTPAAPAPPVRAAASSAPPLPAPPSRALPSSAPAPSAPAPAPSAPAPAPGAPPPVRPVVTVRGDAAAGRLPTVERALRAAPASGVRRDPVVVVPGGHRPGKPDQVQRDQARARLPLAGPSRVVVLGCTAGAGQTVTTLLTGQLLASLRGEPVAVLDLSSGDDSLTDLARQIPRLLPGRRDAVAGTPGSPPGRERGLQVVTADATGNASELIDAVVARYPLTLADPAAALVPKAVQAADQLMLVVPASADAAGALAMTLEWLEAHDHDDLTRAAIAVLNGVSVQTAAHVDRAAAVAAGRCRAVVRVPWDARMSGGALGADTVRAYTALAGVVVSGLAGPR
jgi:hypothetical protein